MVAGMVTMVRKDQVFGCGGDCPYCALPIECANAQSSLRCIHCGYQVIVKKGNFVTAGAATDSAFALADRTGYLIPPSPEASGLLKWGIAAAILMGMIFLGSRHEQVGPSASANAFETVSDAQREAIRLYPELGVAGSEFNRLFLERHRHYQQTRPAFFQETAWPIRLAEEIAQTSIRNAEPLPHAVKPTDWMWKRRGNPLDEKPDR